MQRLFMALALVLPGEALARPHSTSGCERWLYRPFFQKKTRTFLQEIHEARGGEVDLTLTGTKRSLGVDIPGAFLVQTRLVGSSSGLTAEGRLAGTRSRPASSVQWVQEMPDADFAALLVPMKPKSEDTGFFSSLLSAGMELIESVTTGTLFDPVQEEVGDTLADLASQGTEDEAQLRAMVEAKKAAIHADAAASRTYEAILGAVQEGRLRFFDVGASPSPVTLVLEQELPSKEGARCMLREEWQVPLEVKGGEAADAVNRAFPMSLQGMGGEPALARCVCEPG